MKSKVLVLLFVIGCIGCDGITVEVHTEKYKNYLPLEAAASKIKPLAVELIKTKLPKILHTLNLPAQLTIELRDFPTEIEGFHKAIASHNHITLYNELLLNTEMDLKSTLLHELLHVAIQNHIGFLDYILLPKWVSEGLSTFGANQTEDELNQVILDKILDPKWDETPDNIIDQTLNEKTYAANALVFEYLETLIPEGHQKFIKNLEDGDNYKDVFSKLSGYSYKTFLKKAHNYILFKIENKLAQIPPPIYEGFRLFSKKFFSQAANILIQETKTIEGAYYEGVALYVLALSLRYSGDSNTSYPLLLKILRDFPSFRILYHHDNVHYNIAGIEFENHNSKQALNHYWTLVREFPYSKQLIAGAWQHMAACYNELHEYNNAYHVLKNIKFTGAWTDAKLHFEFGRTYIGLGKGLGKTKKACKHLKQAASLSVLRKKATTLMQENCTKENDDGMLK